MIYLGPSPIQNFRWDTTWAFLWLEPQLLDQVIMKDSELSFPVLNSHLPIPLFLVNSRSLKLETNKKAGFFFNTAQSKLIISLQVLLKLCLFLVEDYYIQVWKKIGRSPILSQFIELDTTRIIICCLPGILRYCIPTAPGNSFETALIISIVIGQLPFILSVPLY